MRQSQFIVHWAAFVLAVLPAVGLAQQPAPVGNPAWSAFVSGTAVGTRLTVTRTDRSVLEGRALSIDSAGVALGDARSRMLIAMHDVLEVRLAGVRSRRVRHYGVPLGMLLGGIALAAIDSRSSHPEAGEAFAMGAVLVGLPVGAVAAAAWPLGPPLYRLPASAAHGVDAR